jgi:16S rRNA (uracil1498-N3)-methyltransferase
MREKPAHVPRFFVDLELRTGARVALPGDASHHAARVLRLAPGAPVTLFDGRGGEHAATVAEVRRGEVLVALGERRTIEVESPLVMALVQGVSSNEHMDVTVQKAVELGVTVIQPVFTERSVVRLSAERAQAKLAHWRRIAIAACEQCGRNRVPDVRPAVALRDYCARPDEASLRLLLSIQASVGLREALAGAARSVVLAAGPEAGFSAAEEAMLVAAGFRPVKLGPRVLRTETAAPAALAALNALIGDF